MSFPNTRPRCPPSCASPGQARRLTPGDDTLEAKPGTWVHMAKGLRHSIQAKTPVVMLLLLLK